MNRVSHLVHAEYAHQNGIFGKGVGVAILDTGIAGHPDFLYRRNRIAAFVDFVSGRNGIYDDNGHGTHVAGILGGDGYCFDDVYRGIAPEASLISLKVLDAQGNGDTEDVLRALDWCVRNRHRYNIRIVNISIGTPCEEECMENVALVEGVEYVWNQGIVVTVAAGNNGPKPYSIAAPGNSRKVITVGASDDEVAYIRRNEVLKNYSGRGPTLECIKKPDIVAPGSSVVSCNAFFPAVRGMHYFSNRWNAFYTVKSGTSMSTPVVSGAVALLLSVYPDMSPREVKIRLKNSASDLGFSHRRQGWGQLNIKEMLNRE
ncbi:MAG: S8 family peptidase [Lachnospiraceae bacterium]|nr:S8 family peptidase [Lachnospiraceae bacterium]